MEIILQDLGFAARMLMKRPGVTLVAVVTLALGIGANSAMFSVVNAVVLRPLPYPESDRLVTVWIDSRAAGPKTPLPMADFRVWQQHRQVFDEIAVNSDTFFNLTGAGTPERVRGAYASAGFFSTFGVRPALGRLFEPGDDRPGGDALVVISHRFWDRYFHRAADVVGRPIHLSGRVCTIVGVTPPGFEFDGRDVELWQVLSLDPPRRRGPYFLWGIGRLKRGHSLAEASAELQMVASDILRQYPAPADWEFRVRPLKESVVGNTRRVLLMLLGAVSFVLLIAVVNVANLLLARAATREKELAVRAALGAGHARIIMQLLTESVLLGAIGGAAGLALAWMAIDALPAFIPENLPRISEIHLDGRVVAVTLAVSVFSGIIFGLAPALYGLLNVSASLKEGRPSGSPSGRTARKLLVVAEIALALTLLIGAGLMVRSLMALQRVNPGFAPQHLLTAELALPQSSYKDDSRIEAFFRELLDRIEALPGVQSAGLTLSLPPNQLELTDDFTVEGYQLRSGQSPSVAPLIVISENYFRALRVPLVAGRFFTSDDKSAAPPVVIINEPLARKYFPERNPIGQRMKTGGPGSINPWLTIVGVVGDVKYSGLDAEPEPAFYLPYRQLPWPRQYVVVRTTADPLSMVSAIRGAVASLDKDLPLARIRTMDDLLYESMGRPRFRTVLISIFGIIAVVLSAVGIYSVMSYSVTERTREIGVRIALGAAEIDVLRLVLGEGLVLCVAGAAIGIGLAFVTTRALATLLFGVSATDPITFASTVFVLSAVAMTASLAPARRAARVDPIVALRYE